MKKLRSLSMTYLVMVVFTFTLSAFVAADDSTNDETKSTVSIPEIKPGDKVFFRITECIAKTPSGKNVAEPVFNAFEFHGDNKDAGYRTLEVKQWEFCITNGKDFECQIDVKENKKADSFKAFRLPMSKIMELLAENMKANPDDREKWTATLFGDMEKKSGHKVTLTFAGIVRVYQLKSVKVPSSSAHTQHKQYAKGYAPKFRVYIDKNGENMGQIEVKDASWEIDFPASDKNRWEIREGMGDSYLIRLRDKNTRVYEHPIMQVSGIKAEDFAQGEISEKLDKLDSQSRAVRFIFETIK